ncbi:TraY domain-containing protein [Budviciaceae bacterium BWR-B9]|uniref:Relaxosome protein TraY n=1 Tax=Limnobaculum allomyrinae TaxID=2791986 RepID=A0ABS1IUX9_9GAMM|nr:MULTISPECIES: TraY domain-containing protein [Limnobaculum]MBK5145554.1 TraY domain-containing protein [Limnobaculum allomyrinae]MBV7693672.1 TraY domain-containing protein [Limnobaculum sp. M2-1]
MSDYTPNNNLYSPNDVLINVALDVGLHEALEKAALTTWRSKRVEAKVRLEDSLSRRLHINPVKKPAKHTITVKTLSIFIKPALNNLLNESARVSGLTKNDEAVRRIQAHLEYYDLFINPDFCKLRESV